MQSSGDTRRCIKLDRAARSDVGRNFAASHDASTHEDVAGHMCSITNNEHIVAADFAFELAIEAHASFEKQFALEASPATQEGVDLGGPVPRSIRRRVGALGLVILR